MTRSILSYHRTALRGPNFRLAALALASALTLSVATLGLSTSAIANEPTEASPAVSLSNQHVGMSAEQVDAANAPSTSAAATAPAPASAPTTPTTDPNALEAEAEALAAVAAARKHEALELKRRAEDAQRALEAAEAGLIPGVGSNEQGPATYESCVEATIRRGESYADSDRLCRTIYPEAND